IIFNRNLDHTPRQILGVSQDITIRKEAARRKLENERLGVALQKEQELSELKTNIMIRLAHEFRNPLAIILTSTQMIERYFDRLTDEKRQAAIEKIHIAIQRLTTLLNELSLTIDS